MGRGNGSCETEGRGKDLVNWPKLKEDIVGKIVLLAVLASPGWLSGFAYGAWVLVETVGENKLAIAANAEAIGELTEALGGMTQLFGNAEILENGSGLTAAINTHSNAVRFREGQQLLVTNTSGRGQTQITLTVQGKFTDEAHLLLNLSAAAGRALRASAKEIQVAIEPVPEKKADD